MQNFGLILLGMLLGAIAMESISRATAAKKSIPAYLIVSGRTIDAAGLDAYRKAAGPAAQKAGIKVIGRSEAITHEHLLEGDWPFQGFLAIEQFDSMHELMSFWHSDAYQQAIPLRRGKVELDFVIAIEGREG